MGHKYTVKMRVLLLNAPCRFPIDEKTERFVVRGGIRWPFSIVKPKDRVQVSMFPFYLGYSATLLEKENFDVRVIDAIPLNMSYGDFYKEVGKRSPDLVVSECSTISIYNDLEIARRIKELTNSRICLVGLHVSSLPEEILKENDFVDYICTGEYELTVLELCKKLRDKKPLDDVLGLAYREGKKIRINPRRPPIEPLDRLPFPARHLFPIDTKCDMDAYFDLWCEKRPALQMHTSRGCPYGCNFCAWTQVMYGGRGYRMFSPDYVIREMKHLISEYGAKEIYFDDDDFTINKQHVMQICDRIKNEGIRIPWSCMGDVIATDEEMIRAMASAGCIGLKFGVESADEALIRKIGKPISLEKVVKVAEWCKKYKLRTHATFTFGLLGETKASIEKTIKFAMNLDVDSVQFSITTPFPGTRFYDDAKQYISEKDWSKYDGCQRSVVSYPNLSAGEIEEAFHRACLMWSKKCLKNPSWVKKNVLLAYRSNGLKGVLSGARKAAKILRK